MSAESGPQDVTDLALERFRLGELPPEAQDRIRARLDLDEGLRHRLEMLDDSDRQIRASGALDTVASRVRVSAAATIDAERRRAPRHRWAAPLAIAALVVLALVVVPRRMEPPHAPAQPVASSAARAEDRVKGVRPGLTVYRQTARGSEMLADGTVAHPGDIVRVGYRAAGRSYGVIVSIDGRGAVTLHLPSSGGPAVPLHPGATVLLDRAYELDDAPRFERFFFVTSERPFESAAILEAARQAGARDQALGDPTLPLPRDFEQSTFWLQKEPRS